MTAVLDRSAEAVVGGAEVDAPAPGLNVMKAAALFTALSYALIFAAPASVKLPLIEAVLIEATSGQLLAVATDRFTLGVSRADYTGAAFTLTLSAEDAKTLARMAKTARSAAGWRDVTITLADDGGAEFRFTGGESMTVRSRSEEFPKWRSLIPADDSGMGAVGIGRGYNPARLAKFAKVRPDERGRRMVLLATSPGQDRIGLTVVKIGEDFIGAIMPERPAGGTEDYTRPFWLPS